MRGSYLEKTKPSKGRKNNNRKINSKQYVSDTRCNSRVSFFRLKQKTSESGCYRPCFFWLYEAKNYFFTFSVREMKEKGRLKWRYR